MSSTNKTSLGFNQWILEDKPRMEDFNSDNALVDEKLVSANQRIEAVETSLENKANRTSPKEYSLAMSTSFSGPAKYFKTEDGVVTVYGSFLKSSGLLHDDIIGVLPVGFRISQTAEYPLVAISPYASYSLICLSNGSIVFRSSTGSTVLSQTRGYICISFVAAQ